MSGYVAPAMVELANGEGSTIECECSCAINIAMVCGGGCLIAVIIAIPACCTT